MSAAVPASPSAPPTLVPRPDYERGAPLARRALVAAVLGAHALGVWGLLQLHTVREAAAAVAPLWVDLVVPPRVPTPPPAPPKTPRRPPPPAPVIAAAPVPEPTPTSPTVPPPPEPPHPAPVEAAPPAPLPTPPAPAPALPRTVPATAVQYLEPPAPTYPAASRRLGESGRVVIRVEIDSLGHARQAQLQRSSGFERLNEAALAAVRAARFMPYTENGTPLVVWTTVPIVFELDR